MGRQVVNGWQEEGGWSSAVPAPAEAAAARRSRRRVWFDEGTAGRRLVDDQLICITILPHAPIPSIPLSFPHCVWASRCPCLSVCNHSVYLCVCLYLPSLSGCFCFCLSACLRVCLCLSQSVFLSVCHWFPVCHSIMVSVCTPVHLCLSVCYWFIFLPV